MLNVMSLVGALVMQDPTWELFCVSDATGTIEPVVAAEAQDGSWRTLSEDSNFPAEPSDLPGARTKQWFAYGTEIEWAGVRYVPSGSPTGVTALNRYLRHQGVLDGVPVYSWWPGGDRDLALLVDARGCVFQTYSPVSERRDHSA